MSDPTTLAAVAAHKRLFPLRLSPLELLMIADDQVGYPMSFFIQLQLQGQIDRGAFEESLDEALQRHPLLRACIETGRGGQPFWVAAKVTRPQGDWGAEHEAIVCPHGEAVDLTKEIGLRVWVRQGLERATVMMQFHHACCDGTGAYRFIGDILACYGIRTTTTGQKPVLGALDAQLLRTRKQRSLDVAATPARRGLLRLALGECWKIAARQPMPLAPPAIVGPAAANEFPGFLTSSFSRAEHQTLRDAAGSGGVTLNDLLLRDLFLTLQQWNTAQQPFARQSVSPRTWLRIMMPTDLRGGEDYEMPATNLTAYTFLARTVGDCASPDELLKSVRNETALIKHQRSGAAFVDMIFAASQIKRLLPFVLSRNRCMATAVHSNAADPSRRFTAQLPREAGQVVSGNLLLEEITGVPPLRAKTRATFSISQYNRRLAISLRCDPHLFRLHDTTRLLALYTTRLRQSAAAGDQQQRDTGLRAA